MCSRISAKIGGRSAKTPKDWSEFSVDKFVLPFGSRSEEPSAFDSELVRPVRAGPLDQGAKVRCGVSVAD